jgi:tRNA1Val (adenine37-N6)-methyltransferase
LETTLDSIRDIKIYQPRHGYRFSLDALLLYHFVNLKTVYKIADLGAGSGIIGILLAKRYPEAEATLFELQEGLYKLAEKNIALNGLESRVKAVIADIRKLKEKRSPYDLAVSNPPFRKPMSGRLNVEEEKSIARHEIKINLKELLSAASALLKDKGRFCLIYHPLRLPELMVELRSAGLEPKRMRLVHGRVDSEGKMVLMEAVKGGSAGLKTEAPLIVYKKDGSYTDEVREVYMT